MSRQIGEAIKILYTPDTIPNSKNEYLSNNIPRLTILEVDWERKKREREEEEAHSFLQYMLCLTVLSVFLVLIAWWAD